MVEAGTDISASKPRCCPGVLHAVREPWLLIFISCALVSADTEIKREHITDVSVEQHSSLEKRNDQKQERALCFWK